MEKITLLGSANAVAKADQQNTHLLIETNSRKIMVDCGDNPVASLSGAGVTINQISDLILTHFHPDHVGSLALLIMDMWLEKRTEPLTIYGLKITLDKANAMLELYNWQKWVNMFPVKFKEVPDDGDLKMIADDGIVVIALPVVHLIPTLGLRFSFCGGKTCAYSCDTEPCDNLYQLADQADILLQESAGPGKGHTSPSQAGEIAARCGVKQLVMVHYEARKGREPLVSEAQANFSGKIQLGTDGMIL